MDDIVVVLVLHTSPPPLALPADDAVRDRPATTATAVVVVRVWHRTTRRRPASSIVVFIVGTDHRLVLVVIRTLMIPEPRQHPRSADCVAPARTWVKVFAQTGEVDSCLCRLAYDILHVI